MPPKAGYGECRYPRLQPMQTAAAIRLQRQGWGRASLLPRPVGGLGEGSGALQDRAPSMFPGAPSSPATWRPVGVLEGSREKAGISLLPHSPPDNHHSHQLLAEWPTNHGLLTVSSLGDGPHRADQLLSRPTSGSSLTAGCL